MGESKCSTLEPLFGDNDLSMNLFNVGDTLTMTRNRADLQQEQREEYAGAWKGRNVIPSTSKIAPWSPGVSHTQEIDTITGQAFTADLNGRDSSAQPLLTQNLWESR